MADNPVFITDVPTVDIKRGIVRVLWGDGGVACETSTFRALLDLGATELAKWDGKQRPATAFPRIVR